jgi:hypothetical protein
LSEGSVLKSPRTNRRCLFTGNSNSEQEFIVCVGRTTLELGVPTFPGSFILQVDDGGGGLAHSLLKQGLAEFSA